MRYPRHARYRRRPFCELGLQTSHTCAVIFAAYGLFLSAENSQYSNARVPNRFILRIETEIGLTRSEATSPMFVNKGVAGGGMGSI